MFGFVLNVVSGLRYTRVSAEILFDMRLSLYAHLQRLSPRFYARTRLGDIVSRINNDISEIQRVAAEAALAWVGNILFLIGSLVMMVWLDWRLALHRAGAVMPLSLVALVFYRRRLEGRVADAAAAERRHRQLPDRDAAGARRWSWRRTRSSARQDRFRGLNGALHRRVDADAARDLLRRRVAGHACSRSGSAVAFFYGGWRVIDGTLTLGTMGAFSPTRCACSRRRRR